MDSHEAVDGRLDLSGVDLETSGPVSLDGAWSFVPGRLLAPGEDFGEDAGTLPVPGVWGDSALAPGIRGVGTYRLDLQLPSDGRYELAIPNVASAHRVWIDGVSLSEPVGVLSEDPALIVDRVAPTELSFEPGPDRRVEILLQVGNRQHRTAGIRKPILLGQDRQLSLLHQQLLVWDALSVGVKLAFGLAFLLFFGMQRDRRALWFSGVAIGFGLHQLLSGTSDLWATLAPELPWILRLRAEYALSGLSSVFGLLLALEISQTALRRPLAALMVGLNSLWGVAGLLLPMSWMGTYLSLMQATVAVSVFVAGLWSIQAARQGNRGAAFISGFLGLLLLAVVHDALASMDVVQTQARLIGVTFDVLIISEALVLLRSFSEAFLANARLSAGLQEANRTLEETNRAILRFVPEQFLGLLGRESVVEVQRGDSSQLRMHILFCDIRQFTPLVERMGSGQAFPFINRYLLHMEPAIQAHGGFINQVLGDAILALFPGEADDAVHAAVEMVAALQGFNAQVDTPLEVGFGLNSGELMLGTIGGADRLADGVIGDAVNEAARIEGMTKMYGTTLLIGEQTFQQLRRPEALSLRELDRVVAKGKSEPVRIYEVLDALPEPARQARLRTLETFRAGVAAYQSGALDQAQRAFQSCAAQDPSDPVTQLYLERCAALLRDGLPADWSGVTVLTRK